MKRSPKRSAVKRVSAPVAAPPMRAPQLSSRFRITVLAAAILFSHAAAIRQIALPLRYDQVTYDTPARDMLAQGVWSKYGFGEIRTYGYPLFLAGMYRASSFFHANSRWVVFEVQLTLYLFASLLVSHSIAKYSARVAAAVFIGLSANFLTLISCSDVLTDSFSICLILLLGWCWLKYLNSRGTTAAVLCVAGGLLAGYACTVRPANIFLIPVYLVAAAAKPLISGTSLVNISRAGLSTVLAFAAILIPLAPQRLHNERFESSQRWLAAVDLQNSTFAVGIMLAKYATALPPNPRPEVIYNNPFYSEKSTPRPEFKRQWLWYFQYPVRGFLTLAIHVFGLLDPDLIFAYNTDLDPWYRVPVGIVSHLIVFLAAWEFTAFVRRFSSQVVFTTVLLLYVLAYLAVYAPSAVEVRFGLPLWLLIFPFAALRVMKLSGDSPLQRRGLVIGAFVFLIAADGLSAWIRDQASLLKHVLP